MKSFSDLRSNISEKNLTPAEMKEREEMAEAIITQPPKKVDIPAAIRKAKTWPGHSDTVKNPNFNDELSIRRVGPPPGSRLKSGELSADERGQQERTKRLMQFTQARGGLTGPKGPLPEEVELDESKMAELHSDIADMMDKHISKYNKVGGSEALMAKKVAEELDEALTTLKPGTYGGMNVVRTDTGKRIGGVVGPTGPGQIYVGVHGSGANPDQRRNFMSQSAAHEWVRAREARFVLGTKALIRGKSPVRPDGKPRLPLSATAAGRNGAAANNKETLPGPRDVERGRGMETHPRTPPDVSGPHKVVFGDKVVHTGLTYEEAWAKAISLNNRLNRDTATTFHDVVKESHSMEEGFVVRDPSGRVVYVAAAESAAKKMAAYLDTSTGKNHTVSYKRSEVGMSEEAKKKMKGEDPCWDDYKMVGTKKKNGKEVPNCVPEEVDLSEVNNYFKRRAKENI
jgi:hypothetical protein